MKASPMLLQWWHVIFVLAFLKGQSQNDDGSKQPRPMASALGAVGDDPTTSGLVDRHSVQLSYAREETNAYHGPILGTTSPLDWAFVRVGKQEPYGLYLFSIFLSGRTLMV